MKCSAKRPTAWSRELRSLREQWSRRQSFSAVIFSLRPERTGWIQSLMLQLDVILTQRHLVAYLCRWWRWTAAIPSTRLNFLEEWETWEGKKGQLRRNLVLWWIYVIIKKNTQKQISILTPLNMNYEEYKVWKLKDEHNLFVRARSQVAAATEECTSLTKVENAWDGSNSITLATTSRLWRRYLCHSVCCCSYQMTEIQMFKWNMFTSAMT